MKIRIHQSKKNRQWYFSIVARNNKVVAQSEGYKRVRSAYKTALLIARAGRNFLPVVFAK